MRLNSKQKLNFTAKCVLNLCKPEFQGYEFDKAKYFRAIFLLRATHSQLQAEGVVRANECE